MRRPQISDIVLFHSQLEAVIPAIVRRCNIDSGTVDLFLCRGHVPNEITGIPAGGPEADVPSVGCWTWPPRQFEAGAAAPAPDAANQKQELPGSAQKPGCVSCGSDDVVVLWREAFGCYLWDPRCPRHSGGLNETARFVRESLYLEKMDEIANLLALRAAEAANWADERNELQADLAFQVAAFERLANDRNAEAATWDAERAKLKSGGESAVEKQKLRDQVEQLEVQLAGCGTAAHDGSFAQAATPADYGWSQAYADVLQLRREHDLLKAEYGKALERLREGEHAAHGLS